MMTEHREWELEADAPYEYHLAADARLCSTSYVDDQSWDVLIGTGDDAAFKLQTQYGFRVGLASLVPMWVHDGRRIYQAQTYHNPPTIHTFSPNHITLQADILPNLSLSAEHMALTSQVICGAYTLTNTSARAISMRFELFGHVAARGEEQKLAIITLAQGGHALSMGMLPALSPVVLIENGDASSISGRTASPKIGIDVTIPAGESTEIRWVHAGKAEVRSSLTEAKRWLVAEWDAFRTSIAQASVAIPTIQTGNLDWDVLIQSAYTRVVQAVLRPAGVFPYETFVAGRTPEYGYSRTGNGSDHTRMWAGQMPDTAYLLVPALASIAPRIAEGIVRNYVAMQKKDGFIDLVPSPSGTQTGLLCTPILARMAWKVYEQTQNRDFLEAIFAKLQSFFEYWLAQDKDKDGLPEWQDQVQTRYVAFPTFGWGRDWAQGASINTVETPDLLAYLISEADALSQMAQVLGEKDAVKSIAKTRDTLIAGLDALWDGEAYRYRDRDTNITTSGTTLLLDGQGDLEHVLDSALVVPNRVVIKVRGGGLGKSPNITIHITGADVEGNAVVESAPAKQVTWYDGEGVYTTQTVFSQVNTIHCEGLSRVYAIDAVTMDTTGIDINSLLPLLASLPEKEAKAVAQMAFSKKGFMRPNGITMTHVNDVHFDSTNADGAGGMWLYWQTLLGEALIDAGYGDAVADMVKEQLKMLVQVLEQNHESAQFYDSDDPIALGEKGHVNGIAPLVLMQKLVGVQIRSHEHVWLDSDFAWGRGITIRQHGVYVRRTTKRIKVEFASGHVVELDTPLEQSTLIENPSPIAPESIEPIALPDAVKASVLEPKTEAQSPPGPKRVIIEVDYED
ncbi:MAG: hypothetical protein AAFR81_17275 [Chloroflexota bacterium]